MKRKKKMIAFIIIAAALIIAAVGYIAFVNTHILVTAHTLEYENLPSGFDGYKIVMLSDMHDKEYGKNNQKVLDKINAEKPDVVMIAGDMHNAENVNPAFYNFVSVLAEKYPVYFVEGNHDPSPYKKTLDSFSRFSNMLKKLGVVNLRHDKVYLTAADGSQIALYGYSWHEYGEDAYMPKFDENEFNIFLYHDPLIYDEMEVHPDLMLSGHVHGGFIDLPFIGPLVAPAGGTPFFKKIGKNAFFPKYAKGVYESGSCRLAVSTGLGSSGVNFRFMQPEIVAITLVKK